MTSHRYYLTVVFTVDRPLHSTHCGIQQIQYVQDFESVRFKFIASYCQMKCRHRISYLQFTNGILIGNGFCPIEARSRLSCAPSFSLSPPHSRFSLYPLPASFLRPLLLSFNPSFFLFLYSSLSHGTAAALTVSLFLCLSRDTRYTSRMVLNGH